METLLATHQAKREASANSAISLFTECQASEKKWTREPLERLKTAVLYNLAFHGTVFDTFSGRTGSDTFGEPELAARYNLLLKLLRAARNADARLHIFAQWAWAQLSVPPNDSLGKEVAVRLAHHYTQRRVNQIHLNDFFYAGIIQIWLRYAARLFQDAGIVQGKTNPPKQRLRSLGYDSLAVDIFCSKQWKSTVEFTCDWLGTRGGIERAKSRKVFDSARTLRNAYSRVFGRGASRPKGHTR